MEDNKKAERPVLPVPPSALVTRSPMCLFKEVKDYPVGVVCCCANCETWRHGHPEHWVHSWEFHDLLLDFANAEEDGETTNAHAAIKAYIIARASSPAVAPTQQVVCHKCGESFIFKRDGDRLLAFVRGHNCAAPAVAGRTQGDERKTFEEWAVTHKRLEMYIKTAVFVDGEYQNLLVQGMWLAWQFRAALRESASLSNLSESETKAAKLKLYDLWCQAGSEDFTQWLAEKAIELFAGRESASPKREVRELCDIHRASVSGCHECQKVDGESARKASEDMFWPPANATEEHVYEIRNGKVKEYVMEHVQALQSETLEALRNMTEIAQGLLRGECYDRAGPKFLAHFHNAQRILGREASPEALAAPQPHKVFGLTYETRNIEYVMDAEMFKLLRDYCFKGRAVDAFQEGIKAGRIVTAPAATREK